MEVTQMINDFISIAIQSGGWMDLDRIYLTNRLSALVGEKETVAQPVSQTTETSAILLDQLLVVATNNQVVEADDTVALACLSAKIMDMLTPPPSVINALFSQHYDKSPQEATDYFYFINQTNNHIKKEYVSQIEVAKQQMDSAELELVLDYSASDSHLLTRHQPVTNDYPLCDYCIENEGFEGNNNLPASTSFRAIRMNLNGESWGFSYARQPEYQEKCYFVSEEHESIDFSRADIDRLLQIVDIFPHYFVGMDTRLESHHQHYEGGHHTFPLFEATRYHEFKVPGFSQVDASLVHWPMSVIRLSSESRQDILNVAEYIGLKWDIYEESGINYIIPVVRKKDNVYVIDIILKQLNQEKTRIGLMEAMGRMTFPAINDVNSEIELEFFDLFEKLLIDASVSTYDQKDDQVIRFISTL